MTLRQIAVVGLAALVLAGCTAPDQPTPSPTSVPVFDKAFLAVSSDTSGIQLGARFEGTLGLTDSNCFGLAGTDGVAFPSIFPFGTTVKPDYSGIITPDVGEINLGDHMVAGGGAIPGGGISGNGYPPECEGETIYTLTPTAFAIAVATSSDVPEARMSGTLGLSPLNCFGLENDGYAIAAIFPQGTTIQPDKTGVTVPGYGDIDLGEPLVGSGGTFDIESARPALVPDACVFEDTIVVVYPD